MNPIKVMIVEDSPTVRELLQQIITSDDRFVLVASAKSGEEAIQLIGSSKPDIISMDIRLPGMNGFETTQKIMEIQPTPIIVVSASVESEDLKISMNALRAGALSVIEKPLSVSHQAYETIRRRLLNQLALMSEVKVVRQRLKRQLHLPPSRPVSPQSPYHTAIQECYHQDYKILGIVASTGGPNAILQILRDLPKDFRLPILVIQHITSSFHEGFVNWLDSLLDLNVIMVKGRTLPQPGTVYLPPPDHHLVIEKGYLQPDKGQLVNSQRPSGTVTFSSMARYYRKQCIGILLTGMGEDGASGMLEIKQAGGFTITESEATAVVYGMPAAADRLGATCSSLPLHDIAATIKKLV